MRMKPITQKGVEEFNEFIADCHDHLQDNRALPKRKQLLRIFEALLQVESPEHVEILISACHYPHLHT